MNKALLMRQLYTAVLVTLAVVVVCAKLSRPTFEMIPQETNVITTVPTQSLQGAKLGSLYVLYLNLSETKIPDTLYVNFFETLSHMWDKKVEKSPDNSVVHNMRISALEQYATCTKMSLSQYKKIIDTTCRNLYKNMNWNTVAELYNLSPAELKYVEKATKKIGSNELLAYALTELMPSSHGPINVQVFELLLNHAGREYVELIPALADDLTSFGLYQMTSYAVFDTPDEKRGASIANQALPSSLKIPGSVSKIRGNDHHKAAWLFAVHNLAMAQKHGCDINFTKKELVEFIAMTHHNPEQTFSFVQGLAAPNWVKRLTEYAEKTAKNYKAIRGFGDMFAETPFFIFVYNIKKSLERFREIFHLNNLTVH